MNYSDYDSDGYSSNEDADYVPSDDNLSEDDINECEKEDPLHEGDGVPHPGDVSTKKRKKKKDDVAMRKRKKGVLKLDQDGGGDAPPPPPPPPEETEKMADVREDEEQKQKKKSDDLWASFLSDVGSRPKESPPPPPEASAVRKDPAELKSATETKTKSESSRITITKVFDFAGEEVRVNKVVSADSREAKSFLKSQNKQENGDEEEEEESSSSPGRPGPSARRAAGMASVLGRLGKKQKMSTLEKSKMDWDAFKSEEGITEELAIHNRGRDGYVERKNFLERVDHRQFELEKAVRQSNMKQ